MKKIFAATVLIFLGFTTSSFSDIAFGPPVGAGGGASGLNGDVRLSIAASLGGCWVPMQGQLKTSLTGVQQTAATTLGIGANLPDARDRNLTGSSATKLVLSTGGSATITIAQNQLPNVAPSISDPGHSHSVPQANNGTFNSNGAAGAPVGFGSSFATSANTTGISIGSINGNQAQQPTPVLDPYLAVNTFVCLI
jgi:hypothetical protein